VLLFRLCQLLLSKRQVHAMLHDKHPYIRALGLLFLRLVCNPKNLWIEFAPHLEDESPIQATTDPKDRTTLGQWAGLLITEQQYFGTILPRIPVKIEREVKIRMLIQAERRARFEANMGMLSSFREGAKCRAIYADEECEPSWFEAVVDNVEEGRQGGGPRVWVTYPEYGNSESVELGEIELHLECCVRGRMRTAQPPRPASFRTDSSNLTGT